MLIRLTIKNYTLIRHLEMEPSSHLNVITGETGAGKSIMLGAIGLLLGKRADTRVLWDDQQKCITEGTFEITRYNLRKKFEEHDLDYLPQTLIRREINPGGKSRAFINDTPVTLEMMRDIGSSLMDIHSQHENLQLGERAFQLQLIDSYAGNENLLKEYVAIWRSYCEADQSFRQLEADASRLKQESDFVNFQLDELRKASLRENEQEDLEANLKVGENAEDIKDRFNRIIHLLGDQQNSVTHWLAEAKSLINPVAHLKSSYKELLTRLESIRLDLLDILSEVEREEEKIEFDPKKIEETKERLDSIYHLLNKHRSKTVADLLVMQEDFQRQADKVESLDEELKQSTIRCQELKKQVEVKSGELSKARKKIFVVLATQLVNLLKDLGIPEADIKIDHQTVSPGASGGDLINILFSANKGVPPMPMEEVASGGEFSRLMFCVKYIMAEKTSLPTLVLDEIDSGVSGEIAIRLGKMMKQMSVNHQLITISHLPQIAAQGDTHYFVYKESSSGRAVSLIRLLEGQERISEIAKMIAGANPSALAIENARELMKR